MSTLATTNIKHPSSASNNIVLDASGNVSLQAGTAGAPTIQVGTGTTSKPGIYSPGADQVAISTNGTQRFSIGSTGAATFSANIATNGSSLDINPASGQPNITLRSGNTFRGYIEGNSSGGLAFGSGPSASIAMTIDSSQRVGIGSTAPGALLDLRAASNPSLHISTSGYTPDYRGYSIDLSGSQQTGGINFTTSSPSALLDLYAGGSATNAGGWNGQIRFFTGGTDSYGTERVRIDNSGRLLVGTSSNIASSNTGTQPIVIKTGANGGSGKGLYFIHNLNGANDYLPIGAQFDVNNEGCRAEIRFGNQNASGSPSFIAFATESGAGFGERMRITNDGLLLLGQTSSSASTRLQITGASGNNVITCKKPDTGGMINFIVNGSTEVGYITTTGSSTSYVTSSDYRLKENVIKVNDGIVRLQQLKPCRFNFIADPAKTVDGFLAHEAAEVVPECVTGTKDEVNDDGNPIYQGIDQSKLVPLLTAALQEAIGEIESLKARVVALESA